MQVQRLTTNPHDSPLRRGRPLRENSLQQQCFAFELIHFKEKMFLLEKSTKPAQDNRLCSFIFSCPVGFLDQEILDFWWCVAVSELFFVLFSKNFVLCSFTFP